VFKIYRDFSEPSEQTKPLRSTSSRQFDHFPTSRQPPEHVIGTTSGIDPLRPYSVHSVLIPAHPLIPTQSLPTPTTTRMLSDPTARTGHRSPSITEPNSCRGLQDGPIWTLETMEWGCLSAGLWIVLGDDSLVCFPPGLLCRRLRTDPDMRVP